MRTTTASELKLSLSLIYFNLLLVHNLRLPTLTLSVIEEDGVRDEGELGVDLIASMMGHKTAAAAAAAAISC